MKISKLIEMLNEHDGEAEVVIECSASQGNVLAVLDEANTIIDDFGVVHSDVTLIEDQKDEKIFQEYELEQLRG